MTRAIRHRRPALGPAVLLGAVLAACSTLVPEVVGAQLDVDDAGIDAVFADVSGTTTPGCALGVIEDGRLVYGRGYGMSNLELGEPISTRTVFRVGSVSKQFTAAVVAIAALEGRFDLDDPIRAWVPELPDYGDPLTIRHALHHISGLRDYLTLMRLRGLRPDDWYTVDELLAVQARQQELNFPPGSEYLYSNSGYVLLAEAVERAIGVPFREYSEEVIFGPLGMTHSHFHDDHTHLVPGRADGYAPLRGGGFRKSMTTLDMIGDGGVYTSIDDMVKWVTALQDDSLRPGLTALLETRGVLVSGDTIPYALGQRHGTYRGLRTVGHGGSFVGFRADVVRLPAESVSIVTLCNRADGRPSERALRVADVVLADRLVPAPAGPSSPQAERERGVPQVPLRDAAAYTGRYYSPELDVEYRFDLVEEGLRVRGGRDIDAAVYRIAADTLGSGAPAGSGRFEPTLIFRFQRSGGSVSGFELDAGRVVHVRFARVAGPR